MNAYLHHVSSPFVHDQLIYRHVMNRREVCGADYLLTYVNTRNDFV